MDIKKTLTTKYELSADHIAQLIREALDLPSDVEVKFEVSSAYEDRFTYRAAELKRATVTVQGK